MNFGTVTAEAITAGPNFTDRSSNCQSVCMKPARVKGVQIVLHSRARPPAFGKKISPIATAVTSFVGHANTIFAEGIGIFFPSSVKREGISKSTFEAYTVRDEVAPFSTTSKRMATGPLTSDVRPTWYCANPFVAPKLMR